MSMSTISEIASATGYRPHQIRYMVKVHSIAATVRAGAQGLQLFDRRRVGQITRALNNSARRRPEVSNAAPTADDRHSAQAAASA